MGFLGSGLISKALAYDHRDRSSEREGDFAECTEQVSSKGFWLSNPDALTPRQVLFLPKLNNKGVWVWETQADFIFKLFPLLSL